MPRRRILDELRNPPPVVLPSLLLCDFGNLAAEVKAVEAAGARALHLDVMDGNFVPNITYGMPIVEAVRRVTDLPIDVHMMVSKPAGFRRRLHRRGGRHRHHPRRGDRRSAADSRTNPQPRGLRLAGDQPADADRSDRRRAAALRHGPLHERHAGIWRPSVRKRRPRQVAGAQALRGDSLLLEIDGGVNAKTIAQCTAAGADARRRLRHF